SIEQLVPELAVIALHVAVLPGTPRLDEERLDTDPLQPLPHNLGGKLRTVVAPQVLGHASGDEEPGQLLQHVIAAEAAGHVHGQALPRELVHDHEHPKGTTVVGPRRDEVVGPDVVRTLRPSPYAR